MSGGNIMIKKRTKIGIRILSTSLLLGAMATSSAFASSWSINLGRWSSDREIATTTKSTTNDTYYMQVDSVGGQYDSVEHWTEGIYGGNYSGHTITKEGDNNSPKSSATKGDSVSLNVCNPISTQVLVAANGAWSAN